MDLDLLKQLEKLEIKRKTLNAQLDLTDECESIEELKRRIQLVSDSISAIKRDIEEHCNNVDTSCDKLNDIYLKLRESSHKFELLNNLSKLNRLCKQIDHENLSNDKELVQRVAQEFKLIYEPLEEKLSSRADLPYAEYANKLKNLER